MKIESNRHIISSPVHEVYSFIKDFRNFEKLMPAQVQNYQATANDCSFDISGMGTVFLLMKERVENEKVLTVSTGKTPIEFQLMVNLFAQDALTTTAVVQIDADLSPMLAMIAKSPLSNFINMMADKLKEVMEKRDT